MRKEKKINKGKTHLTDPEVVANRNRGIKKYWERYRQSKALKKKHTEGLRVRYFRGSNGLLSNPKQCARMIDPKYFIPRFLRRMDRRSVSYVRTLALFEVICNELGGQDGLSHNQLHCISQLVFTIYSVEKFETAIMAEEDGSDCEYNWKQVEKLTKSMMGWAKLIGLKKAIGTAKGLRAYLTDKEKEA